MSNGLIQIRYAILLILMIAGSISDVRRKKVPNILFIIGITSGIVLSFVDGWEISRLFGALFIFLFGMTGFMGMGDIKMWIVVDLLIGWMPSVYTMIVGEGLLIVCALVFHRDESLRVLGISLKKLIYVKNTDKIEQRSYPYIPFFTAGVVLVYLWEVIRIAGI